MASARLSVTLLLVVALLLGGVGSSRALAQGGAIVEGQLVNGTTAEGDLSGITVVLHQLGAEERLDLEATTDEQGQFHFPEVEVVPEYTYGVSVEYLGVLYGQDLNLTPGGSVPVTLTVYETTDDDAVLKATLASTLIESVEQEGQWVRALEMVVIQNTSSRAYAPGQDPTKALLFSLPPGAQELSVETNLIRAEVQQVDGGFGLAAAVPPGNHTILFTYQFPYAESSISFTKSLPYGAGQLRVLFPQGGFQVTSPQMGASAAVIIEGRTYQLLAAHDLPPGAQVEMTLEGPPLWERLTQRVEGIPFQYIPAGALALVATLAVAYALVRSRKRRHLSGEERGDSSIEEARQEVLEALVDLDQRFERGDLDAPLHQEERRRLIRRLAALGGVEGGGGASASEVRPEEASSPLADEGVSPWMSRWGGHGNRGGTGGGVMSDEVGEGSVQVRPAPGGPGGTTGRVGLLSGRGAQLLALAGAVAVVAVVMGVLLSLRDYAEAGVANFATLLPVGYAFGAGMVASVNPCGFFLLPSYLSYYLGTEEEGFATTPVAARLGHAILLAVVVTLGFVLVFASIGSVVALGGGALAAYFPLGGLIIGAAMAALGLWLLISQKPLGIMAASRVVVTPQRNLRNVFLFGLAYAIGSLSCTLPVFLVVVGSALAVQGLGASFSQFLGYSLGMGVMLTVVTVGAALFRDAVSRSLRVLMPHLHTVSALFLVAAGGYIIYYWLWYADFFF